MGNGSAVDSLVSATMRSEEKYDRWVTVANGLAKEVIPKDERELVDKIQEAEEYVNQVRKEMDRHFKLAPQVKRYFDLLKSESENRRNPKYVEDALTGDLVVESLLVSLDFNKLEKGVHGDVARLNYPLSKFEDRLRLLLYEAVTRGIAPPELQQGEAHPIPKEGEQPKSIDQFQRSNNLKWDEVEMFLLSDHSLRIQVRARQRTLTYAELGLADRRSTDKPNEVWTLIKGLSHYDGRIPLRNNLPPNISKQLPKYISRLRKVFKDLLGIQGDPFHSYQEHGGYHTKFSITDSRGIPSDVHTEEESSSEIQQVFQEDSVPRSRRHK